MNHTFGIFTKNQGSVIFKNPRALIVKDDPSYPTHPDNPESPNYPRAEERLPGFQNPILGDEGRGKIGRWSEVKLDALSNIIDQLIEHYLKDRTWYSTVRCRESLWNMYRRLQWYVSQQIDPSKSDYQRVMALIKDCINRILSASVNGTFAEISIPICPQPYYHNFSAYYLDHFDNATYEQILFSMKNLPLANEVPGFFRYVSSTEDQEWELVHSVGGDEHLGTENILKISMDVLKHSNASKITFNWRVKNKGFIRFKFLVNTSSGNNLTFFINNIQVGNWGNDSIWQEVQFNLSQGQTYKFDWMVRKLNQLPQGYNAIYIKDIEVVEVIDTSLAPHPPDYDVVGEEARLSDWWMYSTKSIAYTEFERFAYFKEKTLKYNLDNECDGIFNFSYKLGQNTDIAPGYDYDLIFSDNFTSPTQHGVGEHGSTVDKTYSTEWSYNGEFAETVNNGSVIEYAINVGQDSTLDISGVLQIVCPTRVIDHYEPYSLAQPNITVTGSIPWITDSNGNFVIDGSFSAGYGTATANVYLEDEGWFYFNYGHNFGYSQYFEVIVDSEVVFRNTGVGSGSNILIPLSAGNHIIQFTVVETVTVQPVTKTINRVFSYGNSTKGVTFKIEGGLGSWFDVTRNWEVTNSGAWTETDNSTIAYNIHLTPGASFNLNEKLLLYSRQNISSNDILIFEETFNDSSSISPQLSYTGFRWRNIFDYDPNASNSSVDGVLETLGEDGLISTLTLAEFSLNTDGFVSFQYGGNFNQYETLKLYDNNILIWADASSTTALVGNDVVVPLTAGVHNLKWVYEDLSGTTIVVDPGTGSDDGTGSSTGVTETCYSAGNQIWGVDYSNSSSDFVTDRTTKIGWRGSNATYNDGDVVVRTFSTPSFGVVNFRETLVVYGGEVISSNSAVGLVELDFSNWMIPDPDCTISPNGLINYHALTVKNLFPGNKDSEFNSEHTGIVFNEFYTDGEIELKMEYLTYIMKILSDGKSPYRARFRIFLAPSSNTANKIMLLDEIYNKGIPQDVNGIVDWSNSGTVYLKKSGLTPGNYVLYIGITDTVSDFDKDENGLSWYAAWRNVIFKVSDKDYKNSSKIKNFNNKLYDDTKVTVKLINKSTGKVEQTQTYQPNSEMGYYDINFSGLLPGTSYEIQYILDKGESTINGGGYMSFNGGTFSEYWEDYCVDASGRYYPKDGSPYTEIPPTYAQIPTGDQTWAWIDVIKVYSMGDSITCNPSVLVEVFESNNLFGSTVYNTMGEHDLSVALSNTSSIPKDYKVFVTFKQDLSCSSGGAKLYNGKVIFTDSLAPTPINAWFNLGSIIDNKPIWYGGCDGSNIHVEVIREDGTVVLSQVFTEGFNQFSVTDLSPLTYPKYVVRITTNQLGVVSPVTGTAYLSTFRLLDFTVYEEWVWKPQPFNSELQFFIDDGLVDTFNTLGGFYEVSYPVTAGKHEFKWVLKSNHLSETEVYDTASIDFIRQENWICDKVLVTPYCEPNGGDKCIEALIKCLLNIYNERPKGVVLGKKIWIFT